MRTTRRYHPRGKPAIALRTECRRGAVELEAVLITGVMFPLAVALLALAVKGLRALYDMSITMLEWPYL